MKVPVSSPNCLFFFPRWFARTLDAWLPSLVFCCALVSPLLPSLREPCLSRFQLAASRAGRRLATAMPATTFYPCRPARADAPESVFAHWRSGEAWYRTTLLFFGGANAHPDACPAVRTSLPRD